jgi:hypothetical protein
MRSSIKYIVALICLVSPGIAHAQSAGIVECPRTGDYVYLYSSMTTLEVRMTLQCGETVQITGRYDRYFGVRTAKGEIGYVPLESLLLIKDQPGAKASHPAPGQSGALQPARERTRYDAPPAPAPVAPTPAASPSEFTLRNGLPIHLKLGKTISSATAHVGDVVDLKVTEEVVVDGFSVIPEGTSVIGLVTEAEPKKRMGHAGKLAVSVNFVRLRDNEKAAVRSFQETTGSSGSTAAINPLSSGKDVVLAEGTEIVAYVDGDMFLKKESFQAGKDPSSTAPASAEHKPSQPRGF